MPLLIYELESTTHARKVDNELLDSYKQLTHPLLSPSKFLP